MKMKKLRHTSGPWQIAKRDKNIVVMPEDAEIKGTGQKFCECAGGNHENNARLVSAAPEMLEVLISNYRDIVKINSCLRTMNMHPYDLMAKEIREIIEKATGLPIDEVLS